MIKFILLSFILFTLSCTPKPQDDCGFIKNIYGERISWKIYVPVIFSVSSDLKKFFPAIRDAANEWNIAAGREIILVSLSFDNTGAQRQNGVNQIILAKKWYREHNKQAVTRVMYTGDQMFETDIVINGEDFSFYQNGDPRVGINMETLIMHEMGHALGLVHTNDTKSIMQPSLPSGVQRYLSEEDLLNIKCEYW